MKPLLAVALLLALGPAAHASCGSHEEALRKVKLEEWPRYFRTADAEGLRAFLFDGFRTVGGDGSVSLKDEEVAWVAKSRWNPREFVYTITSVTCPVAAMAIIVGEGRFKGEVEGVLHEHRYVSSNVLILDDGRWRPVLSHVSGARSERIDSAVPGKGQPSARSP